MQGSVGSKNRGYHPIKWYAQCEIEWRKPCRVATIGQQLTLSFFILNSSWMLWTAYSAKKHRESIAGLFSHISVICKFVRFVLFLLSGLFEAGHCQLVLERPSINWIQRHTNINTKFQVIFVQNMWPKACYDSVTTNVIESRKSLTEYDYE